MFFDKYAELCKKAGKSPTKAAQEMGIGAASVTDWRRGMTPSAKTLRKIAEYFGVSINDLLEIKNDPADESGVDSEIETLFNSLNHEQQEQALQFLRFLLNDADTTEK